MVRHVRRKHGKPRLRAIRRVETPAGVQAQHDWFEARIPIGTKRPKLALLLGALSYSRAKFCWPSEDQTQGRGTRGITCCSGGMGAFRCGFGRDNLKTGVSRGAGPTAVLNASYAAYARMCRFGVDACRPGKGSDKGKVERAVRTLRESGEVLRRGAESIEELRLLDVRSGQLLDRLRCPVTGGTVREALEEERQVLSRCLRVRNCLTWKWRVG